MEQAVDRRSAGLMRVPLEGMVELCHAGYDDAFEADGVNLSVGGVAIRSAYLPEIGTRFTCRFVCPEGDIEAVGEVVWSLADGTRSGEFGMRFVDLGRDAAVSLERLIASAEVVDPSQDGEREPSVEVYPPRRKEASPTGRDAPETSIHLEGVASPLVGRVTHRGDDLLMIEQELPFLRIGTHVTVDGEGRRGRLDLVDLNLDGDTPRLVLALSYTEDELARRAASREREREKEAKNARSKLLEAFDAHDTIPDLGIAPAREAIETPIEVPVNVATRPGPTHDPVFFSELEQAEGESAPARDDVRVFKTMRNLPELGSPVDDDEPSSPGIRERMQTAAVGAASALRAAKERGMPHARNGLDAIKRAIAMALAKALPVVQRAMQQTVRTVMRFVQLVMAKVMSARATKRRTTSVAPQITRPAAKRKQVTPERPERGRRNLFVSAIVFVAVGLLVYALAPKGDDVPAPTIQSEATTPAPTAPAASAEPIPAQEATEVQPPDPIGEVPAGPPPTPSAIPSREYAPGQMPPPRYPAISSTPRGRSVPSGSSYAVDVRPEDVRGHDPTITETTPAPAAVAISRTDTFGADRVSNPQTFVLRMSRPIERIEGVPDERGFTVTVVGSLSLDRAAPIAAQHPLVERAAILNQGGERAVLSVQFVDGRTPAYRVIARGATLEIQIAAR